MNNMRIAYIFDNILPTHTAESEQLIHTISALANRGCDVTLFIPGTADAPAPTSDELRQFYKINGKFRTESIYSVFPAPRAIEKCVYPLAAAALLGRRLRHGFDLVYSRNIPAIMTALALNIPCIHDTYRPWPAQYHHALVPLFKLMFAHPKFIGTALHSEFTRQSYMNAGFNPDMLVTAHNGFDPAMYAPRLSKSDARARLNLPQNGRIALYSGRMDPEKGIDSLIDIAEKVPECQFIFIGSHGEGPLEKRIQNCPNASYTGWLSAEDLITYLYAADVLMLPLTTLLIQKNSNTVLPIKLYSYAAAGRAIFAPDAPDLRELLVDGENACLTSYTDADTACEAFRTLIHSQEMIDKISDGALKTSNALTWDNRAEVLIDFITKRLSQM